MSTSFSILKAEAAQKVYVTECPCRDQNSMESKRPFTTIDEHHFNRQVDIIVPSDLYSNVLAHNERLNGSLCEKDWRYYHTVTGLGSFFRSEFLNEYIKKNNCIILSLTSIDSDPVYCIYNGKLRLSLPHDIYEQAGLVGTQSKYNKKRYNIEIDLRSPKLMTGSKMFSRIMYACEKSPIRAPVPFLIYTFLSSTGDGLLGDLPSYFEATKYPQMFEVTSIGQIVVPSCDLSVAELPKDFFATRSEQMQYTDEVICEDLQDILEWMGRLSFDRSDSETRRVVKSGNLENGAHMTRIRMKGFLSSRMLLDIYNDLIDTMKPTMWALMTVYGFEDAPVSWRSSEHSFMLGGENDYSLLIKPVENSGRRLFVFEITGSQDEY
ncbi:ribonuclease P 40kDa subunit-domain-containing protein, partial [Lipomyces oligophaga]|uniref:ribonuclease P 40kDa subunit-domain-containing protein n=1 Tax=Lipomyces oligophaga TaxID=45792 RepID=UPI0034CFF658